MRTWAWRGAVGCCASWARATSPRSLPWCRPPPAPIDLAIGERRDGPILVRHDGHRPDRRTAHRWVRYMGQRAGLGPVHPHMLRAGFIMAALDAGGPLREVQVAARHSDPRATIVYYPMPPGPRPPRHAAYIVVAFVAGG